MRDAFSFCRGTVTVLAVAAAVLAPGGASAALLTAQGIMTSGNLVASGNVSANSDIEGSTAIGGTFSGSNQFFNNTSREPANPTVSVYGPVNATTQIDNVAGVFYYGSIGAGGNIALNGAGSSKVQNAFPNQISDYTNPLNAASAAIAGMAQQAGNSIAAGSNALTFNATQGTSGVAYFDIAATTLEADMVNATMTFAAGGSASTIVINVTGNFADPGSEHFQSAVAGDGLFQPDVVFNFTNATTLSLSSWETSVLAPDAATTTSNAFEGFLYTASLNAGGEMHNLRFGGSLPPPATVPEPGSLGLLGASVAAATLRRARRAT
jgi:choice-of-anchor A domain-containing protein